MKSNITYVYIETTTYCNLNCAFCNRADVIKSPQHMGMNEFKTIINKIKNYPITEAKLMGMGEPYLNPEFDKICEYFKQTFPNSYLISSTNGQYRFNPIVEKSMEFLNELYISIDGYNETYEKFRYGASWEKLIEFIEKISSINRYNCKLSVNYVVNPENMSDITKVKTNIVDKYKLDDLRINIVQNWSSSEGIKLKFSDKDINNLKTNWGTMIKGKWDWDYDKCFWIEQGLYINVNGDVRICCMNTESESIGNIHLNTLDEIYNTETFLKIKNGCKNNNPDIHCKTCSYKELAPLLKIILNDKTR